jgi:Zinc carboxypeptidase
MRASRFVLAVVLSLCLASSGPIVVAGAGTQPPLQTPEQFFGFRVGADTKLARWDQIVEYFRLVESASDRIRVRELGKATEGQPFVLLEIASAGTLARIDHYRGLQRRLYFQDGEPTAAQRDEIFESGKAVVLVTCSMHSTEVGATQMTLELVHRLATDSSPRVKHVLDNVIFLLVPSLNPDGQVKVVDWYNRNLGTEFEGSPMPWLYQKYVGHDNNRDMYMFTQVESRLAAKLLWHDWFPSVWLDEHQMGSSGARIFVMPATDPINPNVHPLVYRWNGLFGQSQGAALEAAGRDGIIYNSTYTNFWQGAMAWSGWWHNQVGLLTELASVRVASPTEQQPAQLGRPAPAAEGGRGGGRGGDSGRGVLPPPTDVMPRTEYPRPWLGGRWTLRDIVDYELIATMATLEFAADRRDTLLRQIYEVNRATMEAGRKGDPAAIVIAPDAQADPLAAYRLAERLQIGGVKIYRADAAFTADDRSYPAGTFVVPMTQVFARYAKDLLEKQTYPEVRRSPASPPETPYDVTAWSLGMLLGVDVTFVGKPLPEGVALSPVTMPLKRAGAVSGAGSVFAFDYTGPEGAVAINRLLKAGASVSVSRAAAGTAGSRTTVEVSGIPLKPIQEMTAALGLQARAAAKRTAGPAATLKAPRVGLYQPWTASMDEGWTRWVLEQHEFPFTTLHNADVKAGRLRDRLDVILFADQQPASIVSGNESASTRPEYRGGIGEDGVAALKTFVAAGGTLVMLGNACDLAIERFPLPVANLKRGLTRDQHFAPGTIVKIDVDPAHPLGAGVAAATYGFYNNSPFFALIEGFASQQVSVVARYPNAGIVASGWLRGEDLMAGRAAVVAVDLKPGRIVLFGLRPQHRAQTQATFPMLFNSLYLAASQ